MEGSRPRGSPRGALIVLEGIDGSGTSTHSELLARWLAGKGYRVLVTSEPSRGPVGRLIRRLLRVDLHPLIDAALFAADRLWHVLKVVRPALREGMVVICDRYYESSYAYQGAQGLPRWVIGLLNAFAPRPDLVVVLDLDPGEAVRRLRRKGKGREKFERREFLERVRRHYLARAREMGYPVIWTGGSIGEVQERLRDRVRRLLEGGLGPNEAVTGPV